MLKLPMAAAIVLGLLARPADAGVEVVGDRARVRNARLEATFADGVLVSIANRLTGESYIPKAPEPPGQVTGILYTGQRRWTVPRTPGSKTDVRKEGQGAVIGFSDFGAGQGNSLNLRIAEDEGSLDLVVTQDARGAEKGCYGVQWGISGVSDEYEIIVPGLSGIRITRDDPLSSFQFSYPVTWEAQFVIVQGRKGGCCVWAEDREGTFKDLVIARRSHRWDIGFATENPAPFGDLAGAESVRWRLFTYQGDWRVAARRYRNWAEEAFGLVRLGDQRPSWVRDIRFLAITGMSHELIDALAKDVDPRQTLLYIPGWRRDGYDRNYPDYTALPEFGPFVQHAHDLGFRVMAHVNHFGCDPLNPLYTSFEKYQYRDPFSRALQWWTWDRADPPIKFAYVNPAAPEWRELFISRMKTVCATYGVDALHLDQTLWIPNTAGGLIGGMNPIEGNVLLHRELREALPDVALSGEGLDEVTFRYEAFAQRHVWGVNHVDGTWSRAQLEMAHPVSSYVFTPYTTIYGYLGMSNPANGQLYAAWREAYRNWGVIPTYATPSLGQLADPSGFVGQVLTEARFFQEQQLDPDLDADWPAGVLFPYEGKGGLRAAYVRDRGTALVAESADGEHREVTRVISGVETVSLPGSIAGWAAYDEKRLFGLDPNRWYAYSPAPRDEDAFHVLALPEGMSVGHVRSSAGEVALSVIDLRRVVADLVQLLSKARTGFQRFGEKPTEFEGAFQDDASGAHLLGDEGVLRIHPPWRRPEGESGPAAGVTYAEYAVALPAAREIEFLSEVAMAEGSVGPGKTDGVVYSVTATSGVLQAREDVLNATTEKQPLNLDLTQFAGREVKLRLQADPGPARDISFDWARWYGPRIEVDTFRQGVAKLVSPDGFRLALAGQGDASIRQDAEPHRYSVAAGFPNSLYLLRDVPEVAELPVSLRERPLQVTFASEDGSAIASPQYATAQAMECRCAGESRPGIFAHPPDNGQTIIDFPMTLPREGAEFATYVGLREGSKSDGCAFIVQVNGRTLARRLIAPEDGWQEMNADLADYAGKPVVLSLITDSAGSFGFDWACWGEPAIRAK